MGQLEPEWLHGVVDSVVVVHVILVEVGDLFAGDGHLVLVR